MKLAVESYIPVKRLGLEKGLHAIAQSGFDAVDFTFYFELEALVEADNYLQTAYAAKAILDQLGLRCIQAHAPFSLCYGEPFDTSQPHFRNIVRAMEASAVLGAQIIVVHAPGSPEGALSPEALQTYLRLYRALERYCREFSICVGVENLGNALSTPALLNQLLEQLDERCFAACLDVGHAHMVGIPPQDFIRQLLPGRLRALHIHDNDGTDDQHQLPFLGTVDWKAVMCALRQTNYPGDFTMEAWRFLNSLPDSLQPDALCFEARVAAHLAALTKCFEKEAPRECMTL